MEGKMDEKNIQKQLYAQQKNQLEQQLQYFDEQKQEMQKVFEYIIELEKAKTGDEILAPLSGGIFIKTKLQDNKTFRVNVGASIIVDKSSEEVKDIIKNQIKNIEEAEKDIKENIAKIDAELKK
jgi:prefoldin alpha subunit